MMSGKQAKLTGQLRQAKPSGTAAKTRSGTKRARDEAKPDPEVLARSQGDGAVTNADLTADEQTLRKFDLTTKYGPCAGMTRLERWERASKFSLDPPQEVKNIIMEAGGPGCALDRDLWHDRI
ncbi:hypothetical protein HYH03_013997 [Edaphochlamys debaryana]|uniref:DNA polymerase delta subunit 4 n=1 Tax=Edaphochlamys debaryana TaxID=47281 RepID=A0A835XV44_9CHLO|nr:hypothetical protein HYH03_013997 [Edaphochlamys debaryana]|eukprot:KAG2487430.1 hypothetical protein HYH03_013997 [Edaphochlamys debaryana]